MELKTKTFVFIVLSFLLGGVAGGFIGRTYFAGQRDSRRPPSRTEMQKQFADRLKLNPDQSTKVDSILESFRQNFSQVQTQYWHTFHSKRDTLRLSIRALLTPDQNKLFDNYIKEMDEREAHRRDTTGRQ
ncbi:MAG TPA: hypothetical protein VMH23_06175 [Bacteroidota bacterium]|nr:hypothetical protein [Bacteroidota bacterium]